MRKRLLSLHVFMLVCVIVMAGGIIRAQGNEEYKSSEISRYTLLKTLQGNTIDPHGRIEICLYEGAQNKSILTNDRKAEEKARKAVRGLWNGAIVKHIAVEYPRAYYSPTCSSEELQKETDTLTSGTAQLIFGESYAAITDTWLAAYTPGGWFLNRPLPSGQTQFTVNEAHTLLREEYGLNGYIFKTMETRTGDEIISISSAHPTARDLVAALLNHPYVRERDNEKVLRIAPRVRHLSREDLIDATYRQKALDEGLELVIHGWEVMRGIDASS